MQENSIFYNKNLFFLILIGTLWGFTEAFAGYIIKGVCSAHISGSILTGLTYFFFSSAYHYSKNKFSIFFILIIAIILKLIDIPLLHLTFFHGAIANPIYAFITEAISIFFILTIIDTIENKSFYINSSVGALAALVAVNLFPLVKFFTGISACVVTGTNYPTALYYAHIAIGLAIITYPLGKKFGETVRNFVYNENKVAFSKLALGMNIISFAAIIGIFLVNIYLK